MSSAGYQMFVGRFLTDRFPATSGSLGGKKVYNLSVWLTCEQFILYSFLKTIYCRFIRFIIFVASSTCSKSAQEIVGKVYRFRQYGIRVSDDVVAVILIHNF